MGDGQPGLRRSRIPEEVSWENERSVQGWSHHHVGKSPDEPDPAAVQRVIWVDCGVINQHGPTLDVVSAYEVTFASQPEGSENNF
jgi:hypothetical protein